MGDVPLIDADRSLQCGRPANIPEAALREHLLLADQRPIASFIMRNMLRLIAVPDHGFHVCTSLGYADQPSTKADKARCTNLVMAYNTSHLQRTLDAWKRQFGREVDEKLQRFISPMGFEHIKFNGVIVFQFDHY
jgi:hypothetical protein